MRLLIEQLPSVEAARLQYAAQAASWPWMRDGERRSMARSLEELTRPAHGSDAPATLDELFADLDAAEAYLTGLGIEVNRVDAA